MLNSLKKDVPDIMLKKQVAIDREHFTKVLNRDIS